MTTNSSSPNVANYITSNRFYVEIGGAIVASFTECSGIGVQVDKEVYFEGGVNDQQRVFLKHAKFNDVTLKRGMTDDLPFWDWLNKVLNIGPAGSGPKPNLRRNVAILMFNQAGETMQAWTLVGAIPIGWKAPGLQANATSVAIEELTLAYEGLVVKETKPPSRTASAANTTRDDHGYFDAPTPQS